MTSPTNQQRHSEAPSTQNTDRYNQETYKTILNSQIINNSQTRQNSDVEQIQLFQNESYLNNNTPKRKYSREQFLKSNELLRNKQLNLSESNINLSQTKTSTSQQFIKFKDDLECKYCSQIDQFQNFIRPCLCKGSMQHVHQACVQKDIESNFMDPTKRRFFKPIKCEICKFEYLIKLYKDTSFIKSFNDPIKHDKIIFLTFILTILSLLCLGLIALSIVLQDIFKIRVDYLIAIIIAQLIMFGLLVAFALNLIDLMTNYYWYVLDRTENKKEDGGIKVNYQSLNVILMTGSLKYQWESNKVYPIKE